MKQIFIIFFLLIGLNGIGQITFSGVKKSSTVITNESDKEIDRNELKTTNSSTIEPDSIPTSISVKDNGESNNTEGKVVIKIYDPEAEIKSAEEQKNNTILITNEPIEKDIISNDPVNTSTNTIVTEEEIEPTPIDIEDEKDFIELNQIDKQTISKEEENIGKNIHVIEEEEESVKKSVETAEPKVNVVSETVEPTQISVQKKNTSNKSSGIFFESKPKPSTIEEVKEEETIEFNEVEKTEAKTPSTKNNRDQLNSMTPTINNSIESNEATDENHAKNPKKGSWSIGLGFGLPAIIGDMESRLGYGVNLTVQKALGHVFSLRFQAIALETFGRDNELVNNTYSNYKTRFSDYTLQGVFTLNNLNFYKKEPKVIYNLIAGGGLATRHSWIDKYNENARLYSYSAIPSGKVSETSAALNDLLDKNYESIVPKDEESMSIKNTNIMPTIMLGAGISVKLSKVIDLNLETRMSYHFNDQLDAHKRGTRNDWLSYTSLGITVKIPSKTESMLWSNPVYSKVEEIDELKKKVDEGDLLKDEDKDGIADIFDQDLNTPATVAVDSRGIPADMDKDGVPDYLDAEPFTTFGAAVDSKGVAVDSDNDGVADILDLEPNTIAGKQVDAKGQTINTATDLANIKNNSDFDLIFFDENSHKIKKEFYSDLYKISKYITRDPTAVIQIIGHTDVLASEKYNLDLSEKRANAVYSMLIELFKIPNKNLVTKYYGEERPLIEGLPEIKETELAPAYYLNRRVEFKIVK